MKRVVAITATYQRAPELGRLLDALQRSTFPLHGIVVVDNASDAATRDCAERSELPTHYVDTPHNLGCGGGLRLGEETALQTFPELTHLWILDDDTVPEPSTLGTLLHAMESTEAGAACPQARDAEGHLNWFPGLIDRARFDVLRRSRTPAEFITRDSEAPAAFSWATGVAILVTREALEQGGLHREDFWIRGEDLDFSLRITAHVRGVYVPDAHLEHLPPGGGCVVRDFAERMKHAAMLQNCAYLFARTTHGRRLARYWPGNAWRHIRRFGVLSVGDLVIALVQGAVLGRPAGAKAGDFFRRRLLRWKK